MFVQPVDYFLAVWFLLAFASTAYVAFDQYRNNPEPKVMKWGFILVTLYMGPIALLLYVMADKEPWPGEHETFIRPLWKQGVGSRSVSFTPSTSTVSLLRWVARDGQTLSAAARFMADTVNVGIGQRYDVIWKALKPGKWLIHCHINHHTTNNNVDTQWDGGLMMLIEVQ